MVIKIKFLILILINVFNISFSNLEQINIFYKNKNFDKIIKYYNDFNKINKLLLNEDFYILMYNSYLAKEDYLSALRVLREGYIYNFGNKKIKFIFNNIIKDEKIKISYLNSGIIKYFKPLYFFIIMALINFILLISFNNRKLKKFIFVYFLTNIGVFLLYIFFILNIDLLYSEGIVIEDSVFYNFPSEDSSVKDIIKAYNIINIKFIKDDFIYFTTIYGLKGWIHKNNVVKVFE